MWKRRVAAIALERVRHHPLGLTEGAAPEVSRSSLFHGGERALLVRVIVPTASPVIRRSL